MEEALDPTDCPRCGTIGLVGSSREVNLEAADRAAMSCVSSSARRAIAGVRSAALRLSGPPVCPSGCVGRCARGLEGERLTDLVEGALGFCG